MDILLDVVEVTGQPQQRLLLEFENGERRVFDMAPYLDRKPFLPLQSAALFVRATVEYETVVWPGGVDIAPETLYDRSVPVANAGASDRRR